jgi:hypothetical protein
MDATNPVADVADTAAPETGVADEAQTSGGERTQSELDAWIVAEDDAPPTDGEDGLDPKPEPEPTPDLEEIELSNGEKVKVPKELALDRLRHQDYTRKTQDLAEQRRQHEEQVRTFQAQQAESSAALPEEHAKLALIARDIETVKATLGSPDAQGITLGMIDWNTFRQQALANPQMGELYRDYRARFDLAQDTLADLERAKGEATNELKTKEGQRLQAQREQAATALATRQEETGKALATEIEGWSPEKATEIATFAVKSFGVQPQEIAEMTDPRVWKVLHTAMTEKARADKAEAALKQHQTAANNSKAQTVQPAAKVGGATPNARRTTDASGDELSAEEWNRRELARTAAKAAKR